MPHRNVKAWKRIADAGGWYSGKVPSRDFPTHASFRLPAAYRWRCLRLYSLTDGADLRLLIAVNVELNGFHAFLGQMESGRLYILAVLEDHATHPGMHCHAVCGRGLPAYSGSVRFPGMERAPRKICRRRIVQWDEMTAWREALKFFKISDRPEGTLL